MIDKTIIQNCLLFANDELKRRPLQIELSNTATNAALDGKNALIQGATGIGKTRALLSSAIEYVLKHHTNKAIYAVRTIGQMLQVEDEFKESQILSFVDGGAIRLGVSFGISPMIEKICSTEGRSDGNPSKACSSCVLYNQRFRYSVLVGPCLSSDYIDARNSGVCPYSYMRTNLPNCNLLITTMGSLNQKQWILKNIGGQEEQKGTLVIVDEAHSYLSDLANIPVATISLSPSDKRVLAYSQQESDLTLGKQFGNFVSKAGKLVSWFEMKDRVKNECGVSTSNIDELNITLESHLKTKEQNKKDLRKLKDETLELIRSVRKGDRPSIERYSVLDRVLDAKKDRFVSIVETCLSLHDELKRLKSIQGQAREIKQDIFEENKELQSEFSEIKNDFMEAKKIFFDVKDKFFSTKDKLSLVYENKKRCRETDDYTNFDNIKTEIEELKAERDFLWRQKEEYNAQYLEKKKIFLEKKSIVENARIRFSKAKDYWKKVCEIQQTVYEFKKKAYINLDEVCKNVFESSKEAYLAGKRLQELYEDFKLIKRKFRIGIEEGDDQGDQGRIEKTVSVCIGLQKAIYLIEKDIQNILMQTISQLSFSDTLIATNPHEINDAIQGVRSLQDDFGASNTWWTVDALQMLETIYDAYIIPEEFWVTVEKNDETANVSLFDLDIGKKVDRFIGGFNSIIFISATLEPLEKTASILGWTDSVIMSYDSPFDQKNYLSYLITGVHSGVLDNNTLERINTRQMDLLRYYTPEIINCLNGNIGIFVASENLLFQIYNQFKDENIVPDNCKHLVLSQKYPELQDDYKILAEKTGIPTVKTLGANAQWPEILKAEFDFPICVWMASAGKYGEGIDFPGRMLEACILLGIPFPSLNHQKNILKAQENYYGKFINDEQKQIVHELTSVVFPYRKLAQAAGRVHRKVTDIGAILFWDERLLGVKHEIKNGEERFRQHLPSSEVKSRLKILPEHVIKTMKIVDLTYTPFKKRIVRKASESIGFFEKLSGIEFVADLKKNWEERKWD